MLATSTARHTRSAADRTPLDFNRYTARKRRREHTAIRRYRPLGNDVQTLAAFYRSTTCGLVLCRTRTPVPLLRVKHRRRLTTLTLVS
jgi:hypothetical protein